MQLLEVLGVANIAWKLNPPPLINFEVVFIFEVIFHFMMPCSYQTKTKQNIPNPTLQTKPTKPDLLNQIYQTKPTKTNLPNQTHETKPTKPNIPNQIYQTKHTKPNLPNQAYQTKPTKPNIPNQTYQTRPSPSLAEVGVGAELGKRSCQVRSRFSRCDILP